jgi:nitrogen fixation/metabolism regulation signal transduction histidine kinase
VTGLLLSLAGLWVLLAAIWVAVWPLFAERRATPLDADVERQELEAEKGRLLQEIHELELDFATGKLSDEDHAAIDARLKGRAIEVMKRLDALTSQTRPASQHRDVRGEKSYTGSEVGITR